MLVEQQLKDRSIPYVKRYPEATGPSAPLSSSAVAGMIPTIKVETENLLQDHRAAEVAMPHVFLQLKDWWKGGMCQVSFVVHPRCRRLADL
jgi:mediator of RNA polymerase II transcription subunit 14